jgi:hypothetical protein
MTTVSTEEAGLPLANRASFRLERTESGTWLADDPETECYAEGTNPSEAIAELLKAESDYLEILRAERSLSPLAQAHLRALTARLGPTS